MSKSHLIIIRCHQEWGAPIDPHFKLSFGRSQSWVHENSAHTHTHTHTAQRIYYLGQLGGNTQISEEARALWQEARAEHRELWTGRDFFFSLFVIVLSELRDMHKEQENNKSFISLNCARVSLITLCTLNRHLFVFCGTQTKWQVSHSVGCSELCMYFDLI